MLATFYVLTRHRWVVVTKLDSASLESNLITLGDLGIAAGDPSVNSQVRTHFLNQPEVLGSMLLSYRSTSCSD